MVKFFKHITNICHSWEQVSTAIWSKYPNPHSKHVQTSDVIERYVDPKTGYLYTTRLFLKCTSIPKWGRKLLKNNEAYIIEHSVCKPSEGTMVLKTKNLSHAKMMLVEETQKLTRNSDNSTTMLTKARIKSDIWGPLRNKIESLAVKRLNEGTKNSFKGLLYVVEKMKSSNAFSNSIKAIK